MGLWWSSSGGSGHGMLTQYEVEELIALSKGCFGQEEIESLYKRFRTLDRQRRGYLMASELLDIPELSINPLNKRIAYFCDGINFKEFVRILTPYSKNASREDKLKALFAVWDVNGDGKVCEEDVELVIRQAGGAHLMDSEVKKVVHGVMEECYRRIQSAGGDCGDEGMDFGQFCVAMGDAEVDLRVDIPTE